MDEFTQAYFDAALWSSIDDEDEPLDEPALRPWWIPSRRSTTEFRAMKFGMS